MLSFPVTKTRYANKILAFFSCKFLEIHTTGLTRLTRCKSKFTNNSSYGKRQLVMSFAESVWSSGLSPAFLSTTNSLTHKRTSITTNSTPIKTATTQQTDNGNQPVPIKFKGSS